MRVDGYAAFMTGRFITFEGIDGSGKSTLLRVIAGLLRMDSGAVLIGDDSLQSLSSRQLAQRVGFVSQEATTTLNVDDDAIPALAISLLWQSPGNEM